MDIGSAALQATEVTMRQYIDVGSATGAAGGAVSSVATDFRKKIVDGEDISVKKIVAHAVLGAAIGAVAGVAGAAVTKAAVGPAMSASAANIEGEAVEQLAIRSAATKETKFLAKHATKFGSLVEYVTGSALKITGTVIEDHMDYCVENKSLGEHGFGAREICDACTGNGTDPTTNNNFEQVEEDEEDKDDEGQINLIKTKKTLPKEKCQKPESEKMGEVGCNTAQKGQYCQDVDNSARINHEAKNDAAEIDKSVLIINDTSNAKVTLFIY